ncbi:MAG: hypothetical protein A2015_05455 [Spirochaetes bacterium GWF1_31_7]|nr:MAG: hypothetical protein A2Y30_04755 [Spirochaetes bacterium GWE1_32_154]OHD47810.1 MAG: hypothetical protein A2Y29_09515 [Spirochaetes bacterium GWE2_31_10]OHD52538.1 MAG: hypothetical protein A2015_05455 [Spirochaetes bacterium GWF1_31_7]OHD80741.1 MAG: hypothetical protein A2355_17470 [Spirochaetes bacterium RIFOXYB1_FULL_32_8]HBD93413.1 hypothetical protein [Spirochaetia bacterium]
MKIVLWIVFQIVIILSAITGVVLEISFQKGPFTGLNIFSYFTIQSNIIVALILMLNIVNRANPPRWLVTLKSGATIWILVTGLVFHFLLSKIYHPVGVLLASNILLHYIVPIGMQFNWLIFEPKGNYRHSDTLLWIGYPVLFAFLSLLRAQIDGFYPYWFLIPNKNYPDGAGSFGNVLIIIAGLAIAFSIIGNSLVVIDKSLQKLKRIE